MRSAALYCVPSVQAPRATRAPRSRTSPHRGASRRRRSVPTARPLVPRNRRLQAPGGVRGGREGQRCGQVRPGQSSNSTVLGPSPSQPDRAAGGDGTRRWRAAMAHGDGTALLIRRRQERRGRRNAEPRWGTSGSSPPFLRLRPLLQFRLEERKSSRKYSSLSAARGGGEWLLHKGPLWGPAGVLQETETCSLFRRPERAGALLRGVSEGWKEVLPVHAACRYRPVQSAG